MTAGQDAVVGVRRRLWLLCHNEDRNLEIRVHERSLAVALMAATLLDLIIAGVILIDGDRVLPDDRPALPRRHLSSRAGLVAGGGLVERRLDPIAYGVWRTALGDRLPLRELLHLAVLDRGPHPCTGLYWRTLDELAELRVIARQSRRLRRTRYEVTDRRLMTGSAAEVHRRLYTGDASTPEVDSLCALGWALDLPRNLVTAHDPAEALALMREVMDTLPARAGALSPLAVVPRLADHVRRVVGECATAAF